MEENKDNTSVESSSGTGKQKPAVRKMRIRFEDGHVIEEGSYSDIYERLGGENKAILAILSKKVNVEYYE